MPWFWRIDWTVLGAYIVMALVIVVVLRWRPWENRTFQGRPTSIGVGALAALTLKLLGAPVYAALGLGVVIGLLWNIREHVRAERKDNEKTQR